MINVWTLLRNSTIRRQVLEVTWYLSFFRDTLLLFINNNILITVCCKAHVFLPREDDLTHDGTRYANKLKYYCSKMVRQRAIWSIWLELIGGTKLGKTMLAIIRPWTTESNRKLTECSETSNFRLKVCFELSMNDTYYRVQHVDHKRALVARTLSFGEKHRTVSACNDCMRAIWNNTCLVIQLLFNKIYYFVFPSTLSGPDKRLSQDRPAVTKARQGIINIQQLQLPVDNLSKRKINKACYYRTI